MRQFWIVLTLLVLIVTTAAAQPDQIKLNQFVRDLYYPTTQVNLLVVGDSINASNSPNRMAVGYRNQFHIPWNGWVCHADSGVSDNGYTNAQNVGSGTNLIRIPGETFISGNMGILPVRARDTLYVANVSSGGTLIDSALTSSMLSSFADGNPFAGPLTATLILYNVTGSPDNIRLQSIRNGSPQATYDAVNIADGNAIWGITIPIPSGSGYPGLRVISDGSSLDENYIVGGVVYHTATGVGVQYSHIAHGGWTIADHLSSKYSDAALAAWGNVVGSPTHILIWLGQNMTPQESYSLHNEQGLVFKQDLIDLIGRYRTIWPTSKVLLVSQYQTGYDEYVHRRIASLEAEIATETDGVSFINLYDLVGGHDFDIVSYTTDGIHPSLAGSNYIASALDGAFQERSCPADFDNSGFVDSNDYDNFVTAFEAGSVLTDLDMSGFSDIEDFDYFVDHFEEGC